MSHYSSQVCKEVYDPLIEIWFTCYLSKPLINSDKPELSVLYMNPKLLQFADTHCNSFDALFCASYASLCMEILWIQKCGEPLIGSVSSRTFKLGHMVVSTVPKEIP